MTDPRDDVPEQGRPASDADEPAAGPLARLFGLQLVAVLAITIVLTAAFALVNRGDDTTTTAVDQPAPSATAPGSTAAAPTSPAASSPAAVTPPASSTPAAPPTSAPPTSAPPRPSPTDNRPEVVVFNQSGPGGSGQDAANRLREQGWSIFKVDSFNGTVSTTTVYYPDGMAKQARAAAKALPGDVRPKIKFSNLSDTRLTVILTDDYGQ